MSRDFKLSIFTFRRDLRLNDNTGLIKALQQSQKVIPAFIFDPKLMEREPNNTNAVQFMLESLKELDAKLREKDSRLYTFYGSPDTIIQELLQELPIDAVFANIDYSPYAKSRAMRLRNIVERSDCKYLEYSDYVLANLESIYTGSGNRYQVFTYFYKKTLEFDVKPVAINDYDNYYTDEISISDQGLINELMPHDNPELFEHGGRSRAIDLVEGLADHEDYEKERDYPDTNGTTRLSAHNKFGTVSIREVYYRLKELFGKDSSLIRQLYWRDFYTYLSIHYPHVFNQAFKKKYDNLDWENDEDYFKRWKEGKTGFPIVDAGMRQLKRTGFMHNRIRMVVASFLVKDLHINWQWGEQYFAEKLVDYDVMVNNGNWQWAASTGADAQPYFRIFNPWSQQKKYDKNAEYIKKYVEELQDIPAKAIHKLNSQKPLELEEYPLPIVDHKKRAAMAKEFFKAIS